MLSEKVDNLKRKCQSNRSMEREEKILFEGQKCLSHASLFVHTSLKVFNSCLWYLDSGCSRHMTGDKTRFKSLKGKVGDYVTFDDGSHAQVVGKGTIEIPGLPLLKDVLYIKGLKVNLLSITQICDEDFLIQFSRTESLGGKRYIMVIVDDFSRYTWVEFLREKSEAYEKLEILCKKLQNEKRAPIVKIRSDHGKEFENARFE